MPEPVEIFTTADAFRFAAESLLKQCETDARFVVPYGVNHSSALELFLKCLLALEGHEAPRGRHGHQLTRLFKLLSADSQSFIRRVADDSEFDKRLSDSSDAFATARYFYEGRFRAWTAGLMVNA